MGSFAIVTAVLGSLCCSLCSIGAALFAGLGLGGAAFAERLEPFRPLFIVLTLSSLAIGYVKTFRTGAATACEDPDCDVISQRRGRILFVIVAVIAIGLLNLSLFEGGFKRESPERPGDNDSAVATYAVPHPHFI